MRRFLMSLLFLLSSALTFSEEEKILKAVLFDYQGVLSDFHESEMMDHVAEYWKVSKDEMHDAWGAYKKKMGSCYNKDNFLRFFAGQKDFTLDASYYEMLNKYLNKHLVFDPEMLELVLELKEKGYVVGILSNQDITSYKIQKARGDFALFDYEFVACNFPFSKPGVEIFEYALKEMKLKPHECLFVDDNIIHVNGARSAKTRAIHFQISKDSPDKIRKHIYSIN